MLKSKVHRARMTEANLDYQGSLTLDKELMDAANLLPFENMQILNVTNGERFKTYVIKGQPRVKCTKAGIPVKSQLIFS
ncbi:MAG: aspartate 1-decarboxylase [Deltaproteobacteria bacterium]|nr:aspartate 1-decarboxylase [Deltaproteobacteria bacterium]